MHIAMQQPATTAGLCLDPDVTFGLSAEMSDFARLAGASTCPVLLTGETGSGKTHMARLVHQFSSRVRGSFVRVNCSSIPETLFEREMFGHVRGAFTDAREGGSGFLEEAHRGTLFLDEVGEMPPSVQAKLLGVLEDGAFRRLGSPLEVMVDVRVIAATNRELPTMVRERTFRQDLFYRLSVLQYRVPPLRERPQELSRLISALLRRHAGAGGAPEVDDSAMARIMAHRWPGNIRELENVLRAALVFSRGGRIEARHLPAAIEAAPAPAAVERYAAPRNSEEEINHISSALAAAGGNKAEAARILGMSRSTLWIKVKHHGLEHATRERATPRATQERLDDV